MLKADAIVLASGEFEQYWKFAVRRGPTWTGPYRCECSCRVCKKKTNKPVICKYRRTEEKKIPKGNTNVHVHAWCGALPGAKENNCRVTVRRTSNHVFMNSCVIPARICRRQISLGSFNNFFRKATRWTEVRQSFPRASLLPPPSPDRQKAKKKANTTRICRFIHMRAYIRTRTKTALIH